MFDISLKASGGAAALAFVSLLGLAGPASAVPINSAAGNTNCTTSDPAPATACTTVEIGPHPAWKNPAEVSPAVWISYAETGFDGNHLAPPSDTSVVMTIQEVLTDVIANSLTFTTWADDTAAVFIDGTPVFPGNFTQGTCAVGPIGCEPDEFFTFSGPLAAGDHTITWQVFQVGTGDTPAGNPFGLLYTGSYEQREVVDAPEPIRSV